MVEDSDPASEKAARLPVYRGLLRYFTNACREVARVSLLGSVKHNNVAITPDGVLRSEYPAVGYLDAAARHLVDLAYDGDINDSDGGVYHAAQVAWNAMAYLEKRMRGLE